MRRPPLPERSSPWAECMRAGDFTAAWELSDAVLRHRGTTRCHHLPRHEQWVWDGRSLAGRRVLVRCYHGLGDTVQFIRYLPLLREIARETTVWAQSALLPLLRTARGIDRLLPLHDGTPEGDFDAEVELMELPHFFRTTLETLPRDVPYLHAPVAPLPCPRLDRPTVGLVWRSGDWDPRRSLPAEALRPLAEARATWFSLQHPRTESPPPLSLIDLSNPDPTRLASHLRALDLVLSVDSFPAHLAGALACPVWTLLPHDADWRWLAAPRRDSPWYPTMRLFRQPSPGDWASVVLDVREALARWPAKEPESEGGLQRPTS